MNKFVLLLIGLMISIPSVDAAVIRRVVSPGFTPYSTSGYRSNSFGYNSRYPRVYYNNGYYNNGTYRHPSSKRFLYPVRRPYYNRYRRPGIIFRSSEKYIDTSVKNVAYTPQDCDIDLNKLSRIENKVLGRNYAYDTPKSRIDRIEAQMFGANQSGSLKDRFKTIQAASKSYKSYSPYSSSPQYDTACYPPQQTNSYYRPPISAGSGFRSMIGSLGNYMFGGYPTGFTPQMDPAYMDYFEAERAMMNNGGTGESVDVRTNRGYYKRNTQRSSGMGVTLLD